MNIALIGYGKMGKTIETLINLEGKHQIGLIIQEENEGDLTPENLKNIDVAIDFTQPNAAYNHVMKCFEANVPIVVGTTAWEEDCEKAKKYCIEHNQSLLVASNFSIGVLIFSKVSNYLAKLMSNQHQYQASIVEIHHTEKLDAPSGTAKHLAQGIIDNHSDYSSWNLGTELKLNSIPIEAIREVNVPGTHTIQYTSPVDKIELTHLAKNRDGFAQGAIRAAEFLQGKIGVYTMDDLL